MGATAPRVSDMKQRTLKEAVRATGVGLHGGQKVYMTLRPAADNTGIVFRRVDLDPALDIPADAFAVSETMLGTTLGEGDAKVATVEHLLSALAGLGVDNAYVDLSAPEVPIMDGSAAPYVYLIQSAGIEEQTSPKRFMRVLKPMRVEIDDQWVELRPHDGFRLSLSIDFEHPVFRRHGQETHLEFSTAEYLREVSRARTFGFLRDIETLRAHNLTLGGSLDNAIVLDEFRVLNEDGLRYEDEFIRHKMLDAIGDLYLAGGTLLGEFRGYKSGHELNNQLVRNLLSDEEAWEAVSFDEKGDAPISYTETAVA